MNAKSTDSCRAMSLYGGEGDSSLFLSAEDHKKPNIIRGSGTKSTRRASKVRQSIDLISRADIPSPNHEGILLSGGALGLTNPEISACQSPLTETEESSNSNQNIIITEDFQHFVDMGSPNDSHEIIQTSIQTESGNFIMYVRDGEVISLEPEPDSNIVQDEQTIVPDFTESLSNDSNNTVDVESSAVSASNFLSTHGTRVLETPSISSDIVDDQYVVVQLSDGNNLLIPASSLKNVNNGLASEFNQIYVDSNGDQLIEVVNTAENNYVGSHVVNNSKPLRARKREHANTNTNDKKTSKVSKRHYSNCNVNSQAQSLSKPVSGLMRGPIYSRTGIQEFTSAQKEVQAKANRRAVDRIPADELKPRPFRFDFPEDESLSMEPTDYLSLVIEQFQKENVNNTEIDIRPDISSLPNPSETVTDQNLSSFNKLSSLAEPVKCPKCSFQSVSKESVTQHYIQRHSDMLQLPLSEDDDCDKMFTPIFALSEFGNYQTSTTAVDHKFCCDNCGKGFQHQNILANHQETCIQSIRKCLLDSFNTNKGGKGKEADLPDADANTSKVFGCFYCCCACAALFRDKLPLARHKINCHPFKTPVICDVCEEQLKLKTKEEVLSHLATHAKVDEGEEIRLYKCPTCYKCFKLKYHLNGHIRSMHRKPIYSSESQNLPLSSNGSEVVDLTGRQVSEKDITNSFNQICGGIFSPIAATTTTSQQSELNSNGQFSQSTTSHQRNFNASSPVKESITTKVTNSSITKPPTEVPKISMLFNALTKPATSKKYESGNKNNHTKPDDHPPYVKYNSIFSNPSGPQGISGEVSMNLTGKHGPQRNGNAVDVANKFMDLFCKIQLGGSLAEETALICEQNTNLMNSVPRPKQTSHKKGSNTISNRNARKAIITPARSSTSNLKEVKNEKAEADKIQLPKATNTKTSTRRVKVKLEDSSTESSNKCPRKLRSQSQKPGWMKTCSSDVISRH